MKILNVQRLSLISALLLLFLANCSFSYKKLPEIEVNPRQKILAGEIALRLLSAWKMGDYQELGPEATIPMQRGLTPEKQQQAYESIAARFGDFESLEYAETWISKKASPLMIYRFRGDFESGATLEIRVVMDSRDRLSGFWIKPWRRMLR